MEMRKLVWKRCRKRKRFSQFLGVAKKFAVSLILVGLWYLSLGAAENPANIVVVGDSYAVLLSDYTGWQSCGEKGASFDEMVSLILECDDFKGREAHLLWGVAHLMSGTDLKVVETEAGLLGYLLKQKGAGKVVIFTVDEMLSAHKQSSEFQSDSLHLNEKGYQKLYAKKGLTLEIRDPSQNGATLDIMTISRWQLGKVLVAAL